jgi:hypothetical protein
VKQEAATQTQQETSATESDISERRSETLIKIFKGVQHTLQALSQGFREMVRAKKWAQKAHRRRERRRAARQKEVGNQSQVPVDCPQNPAIEIEGNGNKIEAGLQPQIEDWNPPEIETAEQNGPIAGNRETEGQMEAGDSERPREPTVPNPEGNLEEPVTTQKKPGQPAKPREQEGRRSKC